MWLLGMNLTEGSLRPGLGTQRLLFGYKTQARPLLKRVRGGRRCSFGPTSSHFGPHKPHSREVNGAHASHTAKAVRLGSASVSQDCGLELQQRKLKLMFDAPPAADVELSGAAAQAVQEAVQERWQQLPGPPTPSREGQITGQANAIVPRPTRRRPRAAAQQQQQQQLQHPLEQLAAIPSSSEKEGEAQPEALALPEAAARSLPGTDAVAQLAAAPARRRRGRPRLSKVAAAATLVAGPEQQQHEQPTAAAPAEPARAPKRHRRRGNKVATREEDSVLADVGGFDAMLAAVKELATAAEQLAAAVGLSLPQSLEQEPEQQLETGAVAPAPAVPKRRASRRHTAITAATISSPSPSNATPAGSRRARKSSSKASTRGASSGSSSSSEEAVPILAAAAVTGQGAAATAGVEAATLAPETDPAEQPATPAGARPLIHSTRAARRSSVAQASQASSRRVRLVVPNMTRLQLEEAGTSAGAGLVAQAKQRVPRAAAQPASALLHGAEQRHGAGVAGQQQQSEGERDAAFLARVREALQRGRRKKRYSSLAGPGMSGSISMFLSRLGDTPVLGKEHEMRLARVLQRGRHLQASLGPLRERLGRELTPAELAAEAGLSEAEVALRLANHAEAKDLLMQYNLRLVVHIAKRYANQGVELSELISEGEEGLRKSLERYDPDRGFRFSTYAHWYIRQPISRAVAEQGRDVRLPVHVCEMLTKIHRCEQALNKEPDRRQPATREEIARAMGMPLPRLLHYLRLAKAPRVVAEGGREPDGEGSTLVTTSMKEMSLNEQWEDVEFSETVEDINMLEHVKQNVSFILSTLPKRERNILRMRYGLLQHDEQEWDPASAAYPHPLHFSAAGTAGQDGPAARRGRSAGDPALALAGPVAVAVAPAGSQQQQLPLEQQGSGSGGAGGIAAAAAAAAERPQPHELSLTEVSYAYGLSKERIRQLEDRALRALRKPWRVRLLKEINSGNRLSENTLAHLAAAMRPGRRSAAAAAAAGGAAGAAATTPPSGPYYG